MERNSRKPPLINSALNGAKSGPVPIKDIFNRFLVGLHIKEFNQINLPLYKEIYHFIKEFNFKKIPLYKGINVAVTKVHCSIVIPATDSNYTI